MSEGGRKGGRDGGREGRKEGRRTAYLVLRHPDGVFLLFLDLVLDSTVPVIHRTGVDNGWRKPEGIEERMNRNQNISNQYVTRLLIHNLSVCPFLLSASPVNILPDSCSSFTAFSYSFLACFVEWLSVVC